VLVAIGFTGVETDDPLYSQLGLELGARATVPVDGAFATASDSLFAAGDCVRGADLIVQAIADGREAARTVDLALQGTTALPSRVAVA
jgi:glutamate synthase (NADPH) small chain